MLNIRGFPISNLTTLGDMTLLELSNKQTGMLLYSVEGVGAIFVGIFLVAYLAGLPTTDVLHSEPVFKVLLTVFGVLLLILVFATIILSRLGRELK